MELFRYQDREVRTVTIDGDPGFVHADVCAVLEIGNPSDALRRLDDDERGVVSIDGPNGRRLDVNIITEAGLYSLILGSRKPQAKPFKRWVTHEVLPAIRRTGSFAIPAPRQELPDISTPAGVLVLAEQFAATARQLVAATTRVAELEPAAQAWGTLADAKGDLLVGDAAKVLSRHPDIDTGQNRLFETLREMRWTYRAGDRRWRAYQTVIAAGWLTEVVQQYEHPRDADLIVATVQIRVTVKGMGVLHAKLAAPELRQGLFAVVDEDAS